MSSFEKLVNKTKQRFPSYRFSWEILTDLILENVAGRPIWLDIGAGSNILIKEQPGAEFAVGVDIERWKSIYRDEISGFCLATGEMLPFKAGSFDFVTSRFTFEHLEQPETVLEEISRVLKPGGIFIMQTTNKNSPLILISRLIPFLVKKTLFKKAFGNNPTGTFRTHYKLNTPGSIRNKTGSLKLDKILLVEDILCHNSILHFFSSLICSTMELFGLESLRGNMIAVYRKVQL